MASRLASRLLSASARSASRSGARRAASSSAPTEALKKGGDMTWVIGSALVFAPAYYYVLTPPSHDSHAHHEDYRMKVSAMSRQYKEEDDMSKDDGKSKGKDEQGTQVAKSSSKGPGSSQTKLSIAAQDASKHSTSTEGGFEANPKAHREQVEKAKSEQSEAGSSEDSQETAKTETEKENQEEEEE